MTGLPRIAEVNRTADGRWKVTLAECVSTVVESKAAAVALIPDGWRLVADGQPPGPVNPQGQ